MELSLVVGVDGSESSFRATDWAADEAACHGRSLRLVYASLWQRYEGKAMALSLERSSERTMAENILSAATQRVQSRTPGVKVITEVIPKDTVVALLRESRNAFAVITGVRGRSEFAGLLLGSVSLSVAALAWSPVIVVRGDEAGIEGTHGRILLGIGDADADSPAVHFAFREAQARDCMLDVVRAWRAPRFDGPEAGADDERTHEERASALLESSVDAATRTYPDVRVRHAVIQGPPSQVLLARTAAADLLVVGARRRQSQFGMQIGRVGHRVLHHSLSPVAVVPQPV
ncbi:universal stress protein [Streptomyces odontomachi]|uniref:universal stress protein n=1 Tax=Streptomyces odontomachi TaxID=2944940 RepID=UPI00210E8D08|nr:universal stress protein [Streptomyces sp. ODS25]